MVFLNMPIVSLEIQMLKMILIVIEKKSKKKVPMDTKEMEKNYLLALLYKIFWGA